MLTDVLLAQQDLDLTTPEQTTATFFVALGIIAGFGVLGLLVWYRSRYYGLDGEAADHKAALEAARFEQDPATLWFPIDTDFRAKRPAIRGLFTADADDVVAEERPSFGGALAQVGAALGELTRPVTAAVPRAALRLAELGVLVIVGGALALSAEWIAYHLVRDTRFAPSDPWGWIVETTVQVATVPADLLGAFPYAELVWAVALAYGLRAADWVFRNYHLVGAGLLLGAVVLTLLDRRLPDHVDADLPRNRTGTVLALGFWLTAVWGVGVGGVALVTAAGLPRSLGAVVGFALAVLVALYGLYRQVRHARRMVRLIATDFRTGTTSRWAAAYIVARRALGTGALLVAWVVPIYLALIVIRGTPVVLLSAVLQAPPETKVAILLVGLASLIGLAIQVRRAWTDFRTALADTTARTAVQAYLWGRGVPFAVVGVSYLLFYHFTESIALGLVFAVLLGALVRTAYVLVQRARQRADLKQLLWPDDDVTSVVVRAYRLEDADGREKYYAQVNGTQLLADDAETVVDAVVATAEGYAADDTAPPTVARQHAQDAFEFGIVDWAETEGRIAEKVNKRLYHYLRHRDHAVKREWLKDRLDQFPEAIVEEELRFWHRKGLVRPRGDYLVLYRDPFAQR